MGDEIILLDDRKTFENNGISYVYDFNLLTIEQAEIGKEIGLFKEDLRVRGTDNINDLFKSRSVDYLPLMLSYLVRELKDGQVQPFSRDMAELKAFKFLQELPASFHNQLTECANDFFTKAGMKQSASIILAGKKPTKTTQEVLLEQIVMNIVANSTKKKEG